jgi:hypothetical protein
LVDDKILEADFFLNQLAAAGLNFFAARCYFSAFVSSARTVTFALQASLTGIDGFDTWYASRQVALRNNVLAKFFHDTRTQNQHIGETPFRGGSMRRHEDGSMHVLYYFMPAAFDSKEKMPALDVESACRQYLQDIVKIVFDGYRDFGRVIDPDQYHTVENLQRIGLTVEDIEEELGIPRGWTFVGPGHDEDRLRLLRREAGGTDIDEMFEKYLGRTRADFLSPS